MKPVDVTIDVTPLVHSRNVGRLAERIVANELEWRGYRVSDLNKDGLSPNADMIAAARGKIWQVQVKGASNSTEDRWWVEYGFCTVDIMEGNKPMFNRRESFYRADIVVLVAVYSPQKYRCVVLSAANAERAAQLNLDRDYRTLTRSGEKKKPHKVWVNLEPTAREYLRSPQARELLKKERKILQRGAGDAAWRILN